MAELAFLNQKRDKIKLSDGKTLENRFLVQKANRYFMDEAAFSLKDEESKLTCTLFTCRHDVDQRWRIANFVNFLDVSKNTPRLPKLIKTFRFKFEKEEGGKKVEQETSYSGIVTTDRGEPLKFVLPRTSKISYENSVRLCYHIFALIEQVHALGYVHRSISPDHIYGFVNWDQEFVVGLTGFWYTARMEPAPQSQGMQWNFASLPVTHNHPYHIVDDYISALYVVIFSLGKNWFNIHFGHSASMKESFHGDPRRTLADRRLDWIANLYKELESQRVNGFNREAIQAHLTTVIHGFDTSSPFDWGFDPLNKFDVKLN